MGQLVRRHAKPADRGARRGKPMARACAEALERRRLLSQTFVVTTTDDDGDGSLRAAIDAANNTPNESDGPDQITFAIPGDGVHIIAPASELPTISDPVIIDGYTQSGAAANDMASGDDATVLIQISGASAPEGTDGLTIDAG